ncbi:unnamed protein product [Adineta steineri]|uniref:Uncharacterized protein n=1 Tax=Adineta steineri TaxID=433720 RepID=A0A815JNN1_9BILA|nr:unnamed protein product [Adineta steineri]CAF1384547.1 unnamed protein product [Adineta steineri]CAF3492081.1 unnamed protein product [Adineta steineri]CAF3632323.1 unnamed protein product [Adineta steineri]
MPGSKGGSWKILGLGRGEETAQKAEKHLHELNYPNAKVIGLENDKAGDDKLIELLKTNDWDGVSIGGGINGYDDDFPRETETLYWFNRLVNLVHQYAPKAKLIFVTSPDDLADSFVRVLDSAETPVESI